MEESQDDGNTDESLEEEVSYYDYNEPPISSKEDSDDELFDELENIINTEDAEDFGDNDYDTDQEKIETDKHADPKDRSQGEGPLVWIKSKLGQVHPVFLMVAIIATILIEWIMIAVNSYENLSTVWLGLGLYLVGSVITVLLLKHLFSTSYTTLVSVLSLNSLILTIPLGAAISLITGYTVSQLFSPDWMFTHDFVYVMIVTQLVVTTILMFGIWWRVKKQVAADDQEDIPEETPAALSQTSTPLEGVKGRSQRIPLRTLGMVNGLDSKVLGKKTPFGGIPSERGMVNGLTNGLNNNSYANRKPTGSMPSDRGKVNGFTNGLDSGSRGFKDNYGGGSHLAQSNRQIFLKKAKQIAIPIAILIMIASVMFLPLVHVPSNGFVVDREWSGVASYTDGSENIDPDMDIVEYSAVTDEFFLWTRTKVEGKMLGSKQPDTSSAFVFIDSDRNPKTGYSIGGIGSDHMIKTYGFDNNIRTSTIYSFSDSRAQDDWNGFAKGPRAQTTVADDTLLSKVPLSVFGSKQEPLVYFGIIDSRGAEDFSDVPIDLGSEGSLMVDQIRVSPDILAKGEEEVLRLEMTARGVPIRVESLDFITDRKIMLAEQLPVSIDKDETRTITVKMDTSEHADGEFVEVKLDPKGVNTDNGTVFVKGRGMKAYSGSPPSKITIDGAFGDWPDPKILEGTGDSSNPNIDLAEYHTLNSEKAVFFYMSVEGTIMGGVRIPEHSKEYEQPQSRTDQSNQNRIDLEKGTPKFTPPPGLTGRDTAYVFIDSDTDRNTGYRPLSPFVFPIGADFMIEITGQNGIITSSNYYEFEGAHTQWKWKLLGSVPSASDETRLETGVTLDMLKMERPVFDAYMYISDWKQDRDYSDSVIGEGPVNYHSSGGTRKNGGFSDGDIDVLDGGSCAGAFGCHNLEQTRVPISISWSPVGPYSPGQTGIDITVTVNLDGAASNSEAGMAMRVGPTGGNAHWGIENDGWVIESDPHSNQNNYIKESNLQGQGPQSFVWTVTAPTTPGTYYVEASIQYDNGASGQEYNLSAESTVTVIPEFQEVLPPVLGILAVMVVGRRKRGD